MTQGQSGLNPGDVRADSYHIRTAIGRGDTLPVGPICPRQHQDDEAVASTGKTPDPSLTCAEAAPPRICTCLLLQLLSLLHALLRLAHMPFALLSESLSLLGITALKCLGRSLAVIRRRLILFSRLAMLLGLLLSHLLLVCHDRSFRAK